MANPIDLCTTDEVASFVGNTDPTTDQSQIQQLITAFSQFVITQTSRGADLYSQVSATERYNGNGSDRLMVRRYPIVSVSSLTINNLPIAASPDGVQSGYVIDTTGNANSIVLVGGTAFAGSVTTEGFWGGNNLRFTLGTQNIGITYTAGYDRPPYDLNQMAISIVATVYRRRGWIDQASVGQPQVGQTTYQKWPISPLDQQVLNSYKPRFLA